MKAPKANAETLASFKGKTTLLVDDIEINREIVMAIMEETEMEFVCAENGRQAVEIYSANQTKFDLILMDINMPEMDGVEATRRIRALGTPEGKNVPIIAITANADPEDLKGYLAAGISDSLKKPSDLDEILQKINLYMR